MPVTVSRDNNSVLGLAELLVPHTIPPALTRELVIQCEFSKEPAPPSELPKFSFVTWHASCQYSFHLALSFFMMTLSTNGSHRSPKPGSLSINILCYYGMFVTTNELHWFFIFQIFRSKIQNCK